MSTERKCLAIILKNPFRFVWRVVVGFRANNGLILSGAIAYNTLLSIIPVFTLSLIVLSHWTDEQKLLFYLGKNLQLVVPGLTETLLRHAEEFLLHRRVAGWISIAVMLFFSSIAFMVLENTMEVIFSHRATEVRRHVLVSVFLPYIFTIVLVVGLLLITLLSGALQTVAGKSFTLFAWTVRMENISETFIYLSGFVGLIVLLSSIYMVMPVGKVTVVCSSPGITF